MIESIFVWASIVTVASAIGIGSALILARKLWRKKA